MKTTNEIYDFAPKYATIEVRGFTPQEVEKLRGKRVTIILRDVCLDGAEYDPFMPEIKLEFYGVMEDNQ